MLHDGHQVVHPALCVACTRLSTLRQWTLPAGSLRTQACMFCGHALTPACKLPPKQDALAAGISSHCPAHLRSSIAMLPAAVEKPGMGVADHVAGYTSERRPSCWHATWPSQSTCMKRSGAHGTHKGCDQH